MYTEYVVWWIILATCMNQSSANEECCFDDCGKVDDRNNVGYILQGDQYYDEYGSTSPGPSPDPDKNLIKDELECDMICYYVNTGPKASVTVTQEGCYGPGVCANIGKPYTDVDGEEKICNPENQ